MTNAIARWHSRANAAGNDLEHAYADKLEAEMQEMAIQLHQVGPTTSVLGHAMLPHLIMYENLLFWQDLNDAIRHYFLSKLEVLIMHTAFAIHGSIRLYIILQLYHPDLCPFVTPLTSSPLEIFP